MIRKATSAATGNKNNNLAIATHISLVHLSLLIARTNKMARKTWTHQLARLGRTRVMPLYYSRLANVSQMQVAEVAV